MAHNSPSTQHTGRRQQQMGTCVPRVIHECFGLDRERFTAPQTTPSTSLTLLLLWSLVGSSSSSSCVYQRSLFVINL